MKKGKYLLIAIGLLAAGNVNAQSKIKDGSVTGSSSLPNSNAVLELESDSKGFLLPRVALSALNLSSPLASHVAGITVYNTATSGTAPNNVTPGYYYNDGTKWVRLADALAADLTKDAWVDDNANTQVKLGSQSDGSTARTTGTEMVIKDNGRVGIGMDTPQKSLDVIGEARAERLIGHGKGGNILNTAVGDSSLWNITTGEQNVGVGYKALYTNSSGLYNTAIGVNSLRLNTADANTAIGTNALRNNTSAGNNTAIGKEAMILNIDGGSNTVIGAGALRNMTGGGQNVAIGYEAGWDYNSPATDSRNTFIGFHTGWGIVTGGKNTVVGAQVMGLPAGLHNTVILADGDGNRRIYVDSNGSTGIGVVNSRSRLNVNGYIQMGTADAVADLVPTAADLAGMVRYSTANKTLEYHDDAGWMTVVGTQYGDLKQSIQTADHKGWIRLDGRAKSSLSATQQTRATALGIGTNIPDASNAYLVQNGTTLGSVSGSNTRTLAQNQLPNVTLNVSGTTNTTGDHTHSYTDRGSTTFETVSGTGNPLADDISGSFTTGSAGNHSHTVTGTTTSLNGGVSQQSVNITPQSLSANTFIYLGL